MRFSILIRFSFRYVNFFSIQILFAFCLIMITFRGIIKDYQPIKAP